MRTPVGLVGAIKEAVIKHWYLGLQKTRDYHGTTELKLGAELSLFDPAEVTVH